MIIKILWVSLMFIVIVGILFVSSFGIDIPVAYYEKVELAAYSCHI
jgi:preprotein translocase subunit SecY